MMAIARMIGRLASFLRINHSRIIVMRIENRRRTVNIGSDKLFVDIRPKIIFAKYKSGRGKISFTTLIE